MTPDERRLIQDLFDRMRGMGRIDKDRDAEALIHQAVNAHPDSLYMLVQTVLVQENALGQSEQRMRELEEENETLRGRQQPQAQGSGGGSFLGGLFGSKPAAQASSVPSSGGSPWGNRGGVGAGNQSAGFQGTSGYQGGGYQPAPQPMPQQAAAPARSGGGFLAGAMTTAAGVAGGMLAADAIRNMMGGSHGSSGHDTARHDTPAAAQNNTQTAADDGLTDEDYDIDTAAEDDSGADFGGGDDSMDV